MLRKAVKESCSKDNLSFSQNMNDLETAPSSQNQSIQNNSMIFQNISNNYIQNPRNFTNSFDYNNRYSPSGQIYLLIPMNIFPRMLPTQNVGFSRALNHFNVL